MAEGFTEQRAPQQIVGVPEALEVLMITQQITIINMENEVGAKNFDDYLRKSNAFKDTVLNKNIKGKLVSGYTSDVYRYSYNGKYIDLQKLSDGTYKIISYGKR